MSYTPEKYLLRGLSLEVAELYGKPHLGAEYVGNTATIYRITSETCAVCGRRATNVHHVPPRSKGRIFELLTPDGSHWLRAALFALCGSGTQGCHNGFHGGARFAVRWQWHDDYWAHKWWSGELLKEHKPHDPALYLYGCWVITDKQTGTELRRA